MESVAAGPRYHRGVRNRYRYVRETGPEKDRIIKPEPTKSKRTEPTVPAHSFKTPSGFELPQNRPRPSLTRLVQTAAEGRSRDEEGYGILFTAPYWKNGAIREFTASSGSLQARPVQP